MCYLNCEKNFGPNSHPSGPLTCQTTCEPGYTDWVILPFCTANGCRAGYDFVLGVCWQKCGNDIDVGALCRQRCKDDGTEHEVLGVCWDNCPSGTTDLGALCRYNCGGNTPHDVAGICWGDCGDDIDVGALCRKRCREGFHEVAGVCWGDTGTYARQSMIPKSQKTYDPGYNPPRTLNEVTIPYCNFASPTMMNRMAQFYYDQSSMHPITLDDGRVSFEYIVGFYGVIASSELSCDVACAMKTVKFDPVTGDRYEESIGTSYPEDPGNSVSYRRFYFIQMAVATNGYPADPQGVFTVTGCTHADYTAPDAQVKSTEDGVDPVPSVPKIFDIIDKSVQPGKSWDMHAFEVSLATTVASQAIGSASGVLGLGPVGTIGAGFAGGMAGMAITNAMTDASAAANDPGAAVENGIVKDSNGNFYVSTNNDNFSINHGPIYEIRARDGTGFIPQINFCGKIITTELLCSHQYIVRDTVDTWHAQNPTKHIKTIHVIEPRGKDGCYYKWDTVDYTAATNTEGSTTTEMETVLQYSIEDQSTCVFTPTNTYITDMTNYPLRSYFDVVNQETVYPTREVKSTPTIQGRYIRIRPSQTSGDGFLQISQIAVYDQGGNNLAKGKRVYATSTYSGSDGMAAPPVTIVDGTLAPRSGLTAVWEPQTGNRATEYIEIDLGMNYFIYNVLYFGRLDCCSDRNSGVRIQVLFTNSSGDAPVKEMLTTTSAASQVVDFTTKITIPKIPTKPFNVPTPLPVEANLGGGTCPTRCQDKPQIDSLVQQFNANPANANNQILKVLKAVTPSTTRCDYQVEMVRLANGKKTVGKEMISMAATLATNTAGGIVYGRYVRVLPATNSSIAISQIVVMNAAGTNIALKALATSTSNNTISITPSTSGIASLITDGTTSVRTSPNYWQSATATAGEYIDIDLGQSQGITSIILYGVAGATYNGAKIQVLTTNESNATPVYSNTLTNNNTQQTITYNQCTFTYAPTSLSGTFIQDNTPSLAAMDTSGGVLTFQSIGSSITKFFNSIVNPIKAADPLAVLNTNVNAADTTAKNTLNAAAANAQIQGCPNVKCSDPAVLTAIMNRYNSDNSTVSTEFGGETHAMQAIAKSGISGPNSCDVLFTDLYNLYDDFLYPPVNSSTSTMTKRFILTNTGNCAMQVAPGASSIVDISMNAVGLIASSSSLTAPFSVKSPSINCRDPAVLSAVKQKINTQFATTNVVPNFTTILESFANGNTSCEYHMTKDVTTKNTITNSFSTVPGLDTYITANFTENYSTGAFTLNTVAEYDPDLITTTTDTITGVANSYINGVAVSLPFLYNYDNSTPSTRVNVTVQNLS
jgi:hypothetical protein